MACNLGAAMTTARISGQMGLLALAALSMLAACAGGTRRPPEGYPEPDKFLFDRGTEELAKKHWLTARTYFRELVDTYPQSPHRADAKLSVGDTFIGEKSAEAFVLAANEFREFLTYYPTSKRADYAQLRLGMTFFYQMHGPDRDQTETREAVRELTAFVERYPQSELLAEGRARLREARDRLSMSEYRVGFFYWRTQKWYPGAIERFKSILASDPQFSGRDALYFHLADALVLMQRPAEALPYYEKLIAEFEVSEYLVEARKRADLLKSSLAKASGSGTSAW